MYSGKHEKPVSAVLINQIIERKEKMSTMLCNVAGMQNDKEHKAQIKEALGKIEGVQKVGIDQTTGTVKVDYNEPATRNLIKNCIEDTGFKIEYE